MRQIAEFVAVLSCSLFTGAAVYVSVVEHPARMQCGVEIAAIEFLPSYRRGTVMQITLATLGLISAISAWLSGATFWWLVGGIVLGKSGVGNVQVSHALQLPVGNTHPIDGCSLAQSSIEAYLLAVLRPLRNAHAHLQTSGVHLTGSQRLQEKCRQDSRYASAGRCLSMER
jgi:hypothetical protein